MENIIFHAPSKIVSPLFHFWWIIIFPFVTQEKFLYDITNEKTKMQINVYTNTSSVTVYQWYWNLTWFFFSGCRDMEGKLEAQFSHKIAFAPNLHQLIEEKIYVILVQLRSRSCSKYLYEIYLPKSFILAIRIFIEEKSLKFILPKQYGWK